MLALGVGSWKCFSLFFKWNLWRCVLRCSSTQENSIGSCVCGQLHIADNRVQTGRTPHSTCLVTNMYEMYAARLHCIGCAAPNEICAHVATAIKSARAPANCIRCIAERNLNIINSISPIKCILYKYYYGMVL